MENYIITDKGINIMDEKMANKLLDLSDYMELSIEELLEDMLKHYTSDLKKRGFI